MSTKEEWKETGKDLGNSFKGLGKSILRSARDGVNAAIGDDKPKTEGETAAAEGEGEPEKKENVFNDGTWRETSKDLGNSMKGLGKTILRTGKRAVDSATKDEKAPEADGEKAESSEQ